MSELMLDVGQANELKLAFRRHNFTNDDIKKLCEGDVLARVLHLVRGTGKVETVSPPDFTVSVDRMVKPAYPDWVKKVMHSGLEGVGPAEYDLKSDVEEWLHPDQQNGDVVSGNAIYAFLRESNALADCLGLADLLAIQKKGIAVFRELFKGRAIFGWKSVVQDRGGDLSVPCLCERGDEVVLYWGWLYDDWNSFSPAVRFRK